MVEGEGAALAVGELFRIRLVQLGYDVAVEEAGDDHDEDAGGAEGEGVEAEPG